MTEMRTIPVRRLGASWYVGDAEYGSVVGFADEDDAWEYWASLITEESHAN